MRLVAVVPKEDLIDLIEAFTPMRIVIDERHDRTVTLGRPKSVELVPDRGLRIRGDAHIMWDVAGVPIPLTVKEWQVLLVPRVVRRGRTKVLALEPIIEQFDLKRVPGFIDDRIADTLREDVESQRDKLAWNFARTLSKRLRLPLKIGPARHFEIMAVDAGISVTETELRLAVSFETRVEKDKVAADAVDAAREEPALRQPRASEGTGGEGRVAPPSSRRPERRPPVPRMR
jgi:hypothetical protein